ncbi:hypothetical protein [Embleya sp. NPDC001921]
MSVPWIQNFPGAGWQASNNSGGSWFAYPTAVNLGQVGAATGFQRFRPPTPFTVPPGVTQTHLRVLWRGDIHDTAANIPPELHIDGAPAATAPFPLGVATTYESFVPVPPAGPHAFEVWAGNSANAGGVTRLDSVVFDLVSLVPCGCCPIDAEGTAAGVRVFSCRTPDGLIHWYDTALNEYPAASVTPGQGV